MERNFVLKNGIVRVGVEIGDHSASHEDYLDYIKNHYDLDKLGFVLFHMKPKEFAEELFYEWARFFKEYDICFAFLYTQQRGAPNGKKSHLSRKVVQKIKEIAGDYFIGDMIGETGGQASWPKGYFKLTDTHMPDQGYDSMQQTKENYLQHVSKLVELDRGFDVDNVLAVEATAFSRYNFEAGVKYTFLETDCGDPEILMSFTRGASRGYGRELWGSHIAHEWYGGLRQDDPLKYKRLKLAYYYAYLSGANFIYSESGDCGISSYGYEFDGDSEFCREYRRVWNEFAEFTRKDNRPSNGPEVRAAFIQGNLDGFTGWGGATVWNQYDREEWGFGPSEYSWNILKEVHSSRGWFEPEVYGKDDTSHAPALGLYDVIPIETPASVMSKYDYLIFAGWNTMTQELYDNLKEYVAGGGNLIITAAHLNTSTRRDGEIKLLNDGRLEEFLGCNLSVSDKKINSGVKFYQESMMRGVQYPATKNLNCDPICAGGFAKYADVELKGGNVSAILTDTFFIEQADENLPALIENRYGNGVVALLTSLDYPGSGAVYPLYRAIVREILSAGHRESDLKVLAGDKIQFAVYRNDEGGRRLYLLNTDYNVPMQAVILNGGKRSEVTVDPITLKSIELD